MTSQYMLTQIADPIEDLFISEQFEENEETLMHSAVRAILSEIGEDPERDGLI